MKYTTASHLATKKQLEDFCFYLYEREYVIDSSSEDWFHQEKRLSEDEKEVLNRLCQEAGEILKEKDETVEGLVKKIEYRQVKRIRERQMYQQQQRRLRLLRLTGFPL